MYAITRVKHFISEAVASYLLPATIEQTASAVFQGFSERLKASLNGRQERALKLALGGNVTHKSARIFSVQSEEGNHAYLVDLTRGYCTCPDSQNGAICKHRIAAYLVEQSMQATAHTSADQSKPVPVSNEAEPLEKARRVLHAQSDLLREAIIYATIQHQGEALVVEVINLEGDTAIVRALPVFKDGKPIPQFPFEDRRSCSQVLAKSLSDLNIYR
jgi:uncharacterized Zn finger protein